MKNFAVIVFVLIAMIGESNAQEQKISNKFALGFQINQYQKDFGLGLNLTSPYFANNNMAVRFRANLMFNEHFENGSDTDGKDSKDDKDGTTWTPYSNLSLGFFGVAGIVADFIRLYGEGGVICILPSSEFSSDSYVMGGYGLFGFEFYTYSKFNYFIELGGLGTGASADKIPGEPIYSNGFMISTGFRIQFKE